MRQSTILINAALIIIKMVFTAMNERSQNRSELGQKSLTDSASGILLGDGRRKNRRSEPPLVALDDHKTVSVAGDYAYVNTGNSLIIYNIGNKRNPTKVSETLF